MRSTVVLRPSLRLEDDTSSETSEARRENWIEPDCTPPWRWSRLERHLLKQTHKSPDAVGPTCLLVLQIHNAAFKAGEKAGTSEHSSSPLLIYSIFRRCKTFTYTVQRRRVDKCPHKTSAERQAQRDMRNKTKRHETRNKTNECQTRRVRRQRHVTKHRLAVSRAELCGSSRESSQHELQHKTWSPLTDLGPTEPGLHFDLQLNIHENLQRRLFKF